MKPNETFLQVFNADWQLPRENAPHSFTALFAQAQRIARMITPNFDSPAVCLTDTPEREWGEGSLGDYFDIQRTRWGCDGMGFTVEIRKERSADATISESKSTRLTAYGLPAANVLSLLQWRSNSPQHISSPHTHVKVTSTRRTLLAIDALMRADFMAQLFKTNLADLEDN